MKDTKKLERLNDVIDRTGYSRAWIYELIKKNSFPKPVKIGARSIAFVESEVDAWINERIAERDGVGAN
ncbi:helix-turn-helix transcriptional regulator [Tatumella terrea]|uniref:Helix-turn-helix transcriptional regulator n=1 Tax=Tatumella terrea TaxID=419007 RepID=A0ABW1W260_9GAMM